MKGQQWRSLEDKLTSTHNTRQIFRTISSFSLKFVLFLCFDQQFPISSSFSFNFAHILAFLLEECWNTSNILPPLWARPVRGGVPRWHPGASAYNFMQRRLNCPHSTFPHRTIVHTALSAQTHLSLLQLNTSCIETQLNTAVCFYPTNAHHWKLN